MNRYTYLASLVLVSCVSTPFGVEVGDLVMLTDGMFKGMVGLLDTKYGETCLVVLRPGVHVYTKCSSLKESL